jgi:hypothetical protein
MDGDWSGNNIIVYGFRVLTSEAVKGFNATCQHVCIQRCHSRQGKLGPLAIISTVLVKKKLKHFTYHDPPGYFCIHNIHPLFLSR